MTAPSGTGTAHDPGGDHLPGAAVAGATAVVSGVSIWVNSYGVHAIRSAAVYTTVKNLFAALLLLAAVGAGRIANGRRHTPLARPSGRPTRPGPAPVGRMVGLAYVGLIGGGLAFVLFFDGLASTSAASAAFWRDTLVIWVAAMALPFLGERLRWWNLAAVVLLVSGQIVLTGGIGHPAPSRGQLLVLVSSLLWGTEVIVVKTLLRDLPAAWLAATRMGVGCIALLGYLGATAKLGDLIALDLRQLEWALLTGALLAAYVATWMVALTRARAVDVTSVLVGSALVTWVLQAASGQAVAAPRVLGLFLIAAGTAAALWSASRRPAGHRSLTS